MGLGDCPKCWDSLCSCGYKYREWSDDRISDLFEGIMKYRRETKSDEEKFFTTIFLTDPESGEKAKVTKVDTGPNGFVVYTKSKSGKWKHTIVTEEI